MRNMIELAENSQHWRFRSRLRSAIFVAANIDISDVSAGNDSSEELLRRAGVLEPKAQRRNYCQFTPPTRTTRCCIPIERWGR